MKTIDIIPMIFMAAIGALLFYGSIEDIYYRRITKMKVISVYISAIIIVILDNNVSIETTSTFLLVLGSFILISLLSRGGFGMGDALLIGAIGWVFSKHSTLQEFMLYLGLVTVFWAILWILWIYRKNGFHNLRKSLKQTRIVEVENLRPGMVLADDNFMKGLNEIDIIKLKQNGWDEIEIKEPIPYIPCIFVAFLLTIIL